MPLINSCIQCSNNTGTSYLVYPGTTVKQEGRLTIRLKKPPFPVTVCDRCTKKEQKKASKDFARRLMLGLCVLGLYVGALFTSSLETVPAVILGFLLFLGILYLKVEALSVRSTNKHVIKILRRHKSSFISGDYTTIFMDYQVEHMKKNNVTIIEE